MRALLLATLTALAFAAPAAADIGIVGVSPSAARYGAIVRVHVNGYLPLIHPVSMPVVIVPASAMPRPYACPRLGGICSPIAWRGRIERPPYRILGFASHWRRDRGQPDHADAFLRARVPQLPPGLYRLALWCGSCVRGPQGSLIAGPALTVR